MPVFACRPGNFITERALYGGADSGRFSIIGGNYTATGERPSRQSYGPMVRGGPTRF